MGSRVNFSLVLIALSVFASSGCTHLQLQRNSNRQARTISTLNEQQVLDNLAMFVCRPYATPSFSTPATGLNQVQDQGGFILGAGGFTGNFWNALSANGTRTIQESWTLNPIIDPNRLRLMQCAYQHAVGASPAECQHCCEIELDWYGSDYDCNGPCAITCGWLQHSNRWRDVPKCCCEHYGYYCGTYVWVDPCYEHEFSKLVMTIVEFASGSPHAEPAQPSQAPASVGSSIDDLATPMKPRRTFGNPAQYNSVLGGGLLQLQQQLNTTNVLRH